MHTNTHWRFGGQVIAHILKLHRLGSHVATHQCRVVPFAIESLDGIRPLFPGYEIKPQPKQLRGLGKPA